MTSATMKACKRLKPLCSKCGTSKNLEAHHIKAVADGGEDVIENLDSLCHGCHKEWHRYEGSMDYEDFIDLPPSIILAGCAVKFPEKTMAEIIQYWHLAMVLKTASHLARRPVPLDEIYGGVVQ